MKKYRLCLLIISLCAVLFMNTCTACTGGLGGGGFTYGKLPVSSVSSPTHTSAARSTYGPQNVLDPGEETSWQYSQERTGGNGYRTYIVIRLEEPCTVEALLIKNGFWKITDGIDQYWRNNRVKDAAVYFLYADANDFSDPVYYTFADSKQTAHIDLGRRSNVTALLFRIDTVYRGNKFDDVAITYMEVLGELNSMPGSGSNGSSHPGVGIPGFNYAGLRASLNQRMATRTGPGTQYTEPGTFAQSTPITVFYQTSGSGVMWGMVEFQYKSMWYRAYTGMKRIDASWVPTDSEPYQNRTISRNVTPRYGPGEYYAEQPHTIPSGERVKVFFTQNGYAMVDYDRQGGVVRGWIPVSSLR